MCYLSLMSSKQTDTFAAQKMHINWNSCIMCDRTLRIEKKNMFIKIDSCSSWRSNYIGNFFLPVRQSAIVCQSVYSLGFFIRIHSHIITQFVSLSTCVVCDCIMHQTMRHLRAAMDWPEGLLPPTGKHWPIVRRKFNLEIWKKKKIETSTTHTAQSNEKYYINSHVIL